MKKLAAIVCIMVILFGGAYLLVRELRDGSLHTVVTTPTAPDTTSQYSSVNACDVLTEAVASQVLGAKPTRSALSLKTASGIHMSVSNCTYYIKPAAKSATDQQQNTYTVTVLVQSATDSIGATINQTQFATLPAGSQWVPGFGAKAYWSPKVGQLNILNNNNWYIVSYYRGSDPAAASLDQVTELADAVQGNLQ